MGLDMAKSGLMYSVRLKLSVILKQFLKLIVRSLSGMSNKFISCISFVVFIFVLSVSSICANVPLSTIICGEIMLKK